MKKLIVLVTLLAVALIAAVPALAQEIPETTMIDTPVKDAGATPSNPPPAPPPEEAKPTTPPAEEVVEDIDAEESADVAEESADVAEESADVAVPVENTPTPDAGKDPVQVEEKSDDDVAVKEVNQDAGGRAAQDAGDVPAENKAEDKAEDKGKAADAGDQEAGSRAGKETGDKKDDDTAEKKAEDKKAGDSKEAESKKAAKKTENKKAGNSKKGKDGGIDQNSDQDADSGDVNQTVNIVNTGDNVNMCIAVLQVANTGNLQDSRQSVQKDSKTGKVERKDGSSITITPKLVLKCKQKIIQIVQAQQQTETFGKKLKNPVPKVSRVNASRLIKGGSQPIRRGSQAIRGGAQLLKGGFQPIRGGSQSIRSSAQLLKGGSQPRVVSTKSGAKAAQQPSARARSLPRTGGIHLGYAALLGLSVGVPLIGGGLLLRRISR